MPLLENEHYQIRSVKDNYTSKTATLLHVFTSEAAFLVLAEHVSLNGVGGGHEIITKEHIAQNGIEVN